MLLLLRSLLIGALAALGACRDGSKGDAPALAAKNPETQIDAAVGTGLGATGKADSGASSGSGAVSGGDAGDAAASAQSDAASGPLLLNDAGVDAPPVPFRDPGAGPWMKVPASEVADVCKLDPKLLAAADVQLNVPWAVVRYGKLCHEFYPPGQTAETVAEVFSTTKTLGAVVVGVASHETRDLPRTGRKTGQLSDLDRVDHWLDNFSYNADAQVAHVLAMVGHNTDLAYGKKQHSYDGDGSAQINTLSDMVNTAIAQDADRLGANIEEFTQRFVFEPLGMTASTWSGGATDKIFAYTWSSSVREMARLGLLVHNRGYWQGRSLLSPEWAYRITHPAFEDGNTAYGYLTWLSSWSNHSIGFSPPTAQGANIPCTPVALWPSYPHGELSNAPDCNYEAPYKCTQELDVGVWQAVGLGGQVIQGHPGLDMVLVVRNELLGGAGLWPAVLPAVVAADPKFSGDQTAFCKAYESNTYAPDLVAPWPEF